MSHWLIKKGEYLHTDFVNNVNNIIWCIDADFIPNLDIN